jgi:hypothetical protein
MKRLLTLALCLAFSIPALASVIVDSPNLSTQRPQIQVTRDWKPAPDLPVDIDLSYSRHGDDTHPRDRHLRLVTDAKGSITLPRLRVGEYTVFMRAGSHLRGSLFITVVPGKKNRHYVELVAAFNKKWHLAQRPGSKLYVNLTAFNFKVTTIAQWLKRQQQLPANKLSAFHGTVCDFTGAVIPHSLIEIYKVDGSKHSRPKKLKTNALGGFTARLREGEYIVTFESPGFMNTARHILISKHASNHPLKITMMLGPVGE